MVVLKKDESNIAKEVKLCADNQKKVKYRKKLFSMKKSSWRIAPNIDNKRTMIVFMIVVMDRAMAGQCTPCVLVTGEAAQAVNLK